MISCQHPRAPRRLNGYFAAKFKIEMGSGFKLKMKRRQKRRPQIATLSKADGGILSPILVAMADAPGESFETGV
jgi:hypothetical protein